MIFSDFLFILGNTIYKHKFFIYEVNIMYGHTVEKSQLKGYNPVFDSLQKKKTL